MSSPGPQIRPATDSDAPGIAAVFLASRAGMTYLPALHTQDEAREWIKGWVQTGEVLVVDGADGIVGFAVLSDLMLELLYVHPNAQNRGVGTGLLTEAMRRRPGGLQLWVFQQNNGARALYQRHGFEVLELGDGSGNEEGLPDAKYGWAGNRPERTQ